MLLAHENPHVDGWESDRSGPLYRCQKTGIPNGHAKTPSKSCLRMLKFLYSSSTYIPILIMLYPTIRSKYLKMKNGVAKKDGSISVAVGWSLSDGTVAVSRLLFWLDAVGRLLWDGCYELIAVSDGRFVSVYVLARSIEGNQA